MGQRTTARLFNTLMTEVLGYKTYLAQGGDWGAMVTSWLGRDHGKSARAIHLNMLGFRPHGGPEGEAEIAWATKQAGAMEMMGAYFRLQVSKPQSIAWMGAGNPVGQAAWIAERFHDWSDLREKPMDEVYPKDRLLTNIMIYVMTGSFTTGAWYYRGLIEEGGLAFEPGHRLEVPTAFANFPGEPLYSAPPRGDPARTAGRSAGNGRTSRHRSPGGRPPSGVGRIGHYAGKPGWGQASRPRKKSGGWPLERMRDTRNSRTRLQLGPGCAGIGCCAAGWARRP